ncbi:MAG: GNAT family N-acetyltransferase [Clostridiales bacterium]|jgi:ribosomal-protein-alanine N-acetyltransferase|nr:GNAT family N-acetyltransferase [Clostridiales bacterium]
MELKTERLIIRPYKEEDLPEHHRIISDKNNLYYLNDIATETEEESLQNLIEAIELMKTGKARRFALTADGKLIGSVGYDVSEETPEGRTAHMGWFIASDEQGKGYATEAAARILEYAFTQDNCIKIKTGCYAKNIPTQKVMKKLGFGHKTFIKNAQLHDGEMKDRIRFSMSKDEFLKNRKRIANEFRINNFLRWDSTKENIRAVFFLTYLIVSGVLLTLGYFVPLAYVINPAFNGVAVFMLWYTVAYLVFWLSLLLIGIIKKYIVLIRMYQIYWFALMVILVVWSINTNIFSFIGFFAGFLPLGGFDAYVFYKENGYTNIHNVNITVTVSIIMFLLGLFYEIIFRIKNYFMKRKQSE